jgi:long-chain acyl-CoA synthetase
MRELTVPKVIDLDPAASLVDTVLRRAAEDPDGAVFLRRGAGGVWSPVTAAAFLSDVRRAAAGLVGAGVEAGDRVGLMCRTRYEWAVVDYAVWLAGGVTVPIYETSAAEQIEWILHDSGAVAVVVETAEHEALFRQVQERLPHVRSLWQLEGGGLDALAACAGPDDARLLQARRDAVDGSSLATIIYTSGTTGRPKGCQLTHGNLLGRARSAALVVPEAFNPSGSTLMFLPLAHSFGRFIQIACVESGAQMGHSADIKGVLSDLQTFRPTFLLAAPRVFEKIYNTAKTTAHAGGKGRIFDAAEAAATAYSRALDSGGAGPFLRVRHALFDRLVYSRLRSTLGGRVRLAFSGSAPLGARLGHFFRGCGITVLEGYGLTETSAPATGSSPTAMRIGTVGRPGPGVSIRIADDGEILIRGDNVFPGYWRNDAATAEAFDADGWFRSGDIGQLDGDGYVTITGRKKELIVTAGGKNVAPAVLEDRLRAHPLVSQCMVVGDQKPFIGCLITLDAEALPGWLKARGLPADMPVGEAAGRTEVRDELQSAVDDANRAVSKAEGIRAFRVLEQDWTIEGGQLTPSLKLKRAVVQAELADEIDAIYDVSAAPRASAAPS